MKVELAKIGRTQTEFAPLAGVTFGTLNRVLNGHAQSWPSLRRRIAEALDRPEAELFPEEVGDG